MHYEDINTSSFDGVEVIGFVVMIVLLWAVITYVIDAIAFSSLAKKNGHKNIAFYAWIPVLNIYLMGVLAGESGRTNFKGKNLALFYIIGALLSALPIIGWMFNILLLIAFGIILVDLFDRMEFESPILMCILCLFIPFVQPIVFFMNRKKEFAK